MNKNTFYQVIAVLMVGTILYYMDSSQNILGTPQTLEKENDELPYAVAGNTATQHFSEKGLLDYTFNAKQLKYFNGVDNINLTSTESEPGGEYTLLEEPKFVIYLPDRSWKIESLTGIITEQGKVITLEGSVRVWRNDDEDNSNTELTTESLTIMPHEKFAETEEPVRISSNKGEITAVGMQVSFSDKKIKLLSKVREHHEAF